jgi:hypothetical protein
MTTLEKTFVVIGFLLGSLFSWGSMAAQESPMETVLRSKTAYNVYPEYIAQMSGVTIKPYPKYAWSEARQCISTVLHRIAPQIKPPHLVVTPSGVVSFTVHDAKADSAMGVINRGGYGDKIGYAFLDHDMVVMTEAAAFNHGDLRHEALHFFVWAMLGRMGHPEEVFTPCGKDLPQ